MNKPILSLRRPCHLDRLALHSYAHTCTRLTIPALG
jgi:hypothetical protein